MSKISQKVEKVIQQADFLDEVDRKFLVKFMATQKDEAKEAFLRETENSPGALKVMANFIRLRFFNGIASVKKYGAHLIKEKSKRLKNNN